MSRGFHIVRTGSLPQTAMGPENSLASNGTDPEDFLSVSQPLHLLERQLDAYLDGARYASAEAPRNCTHNKLALNAATRNRKYNRLAVTEVREN